MTPLEEVIVLNVTANSDDEQGQYRQSSSSRKRLMTCKGNNVMRENPVADTISSTAVLQENNEGRQRHDERLPEQKGDLLSKRVRRASLALLEQEDIPDVSMRQIRPVKISKLRRFFKPVISVTGSLMLSLAAVFIGVFRTSDRLFDIQLWRWLMILATIPLAILLASATVKVLTWGVESSLTIIKHTLYYLLGIRRSYRNFLISCFMLSSYASLIATDSHAHKGISHQGYKVCNVGVRTLICLTIFAGINLISALLAKTLSAKYHHETHFQKMHDALKNEYLLRLLCSERSSVYEGVDKQHKKPRRGSMLVVEELTIEEATTTVSNKDGEDNADMMIKMHRLEKHIRTQDLSNGFSDAILAAGNRNKDVQSADTDARHLGYFLYWHLCRNTDRDYIISDDLQGLVPTKYIKDAFSMLDKNQNDKVTLAEIQESITKIYTTRNNLANTLRDAEDIVGRLKVIFRGLFHTLGFFVYLLIFELNVARIYLTFSSMVVVSSLIFAPSIRNVYESVVFLFLVHPFDVGDTIKLESGDLVTVNRMGLSTCEVTKKADNSKIWYPNNKLIVMALTNISRSGNKSDKFEIYLDIGTPVSTFESIREVCLEHMAKHPQDYIQKCTCFIVGSQEPMKILLSIGWQAAFPQSETERFAEARHQLYTVISDKLATLEAVYSAPTVPTLEKLPETNMKTAATVVTQLLKPEFLKTSK